MTELTRNIVARIYSEQRYNHNHGPDGKFTSGSKTAVGVDKTAQSSIIKLKINMFDESDPIFLDALSIEEEVGFEDIHLHGSSSLVQVVRNGKRIDLDVDDFIDDIKSKGYKGGDIRLCSCSTGKGHNSFAQRLSKKLGIKVKAPDDDLYYIPDDGVLHIGSPFTDLGKWRIFDKGVEIID